MSDYQLSSLSGSALDPNTKSHDVLPSEEVEQAIARTRPSNEITGFRLAVIVASLCTAVFCVALDNTILATAIPQITDQFHTIEDIGWYGASYFLTICSLQLFYAKLYSMIPVKLLFLAAFSIFEIGSLVSATASSSPALVVGRAISGIGAAGIFIGAMTTVALVAPMRLRPLIVGCIGATFGGCAVIGPLIGGALAQAWQWRWCFYLNLPIGACTATGILVFLKAEQKLPNANGSIRQRLWRIDPVGNTLFAATVVCLLLAVQWGGQKYAWSSGRVIALFIISAVAAIAFIGWQWARGEKATIPQHLITHRTTMFATLFAFFVGSAIFVTLYFLPIWFQGVQGVSPILSAVHMLPLIACQVLGTFAAGYLTTRFGSYIPFVYASTIFIVVGCGLLYTLHVDESTVDWIGYQIILGFGIGFGLQQPVVAAQTSLPPQDIPIAVSLTYTFLYLGGAIFVSAGESIFSSRLRKSIASLSIPGFDVETVIRAGVRELRNQVPSEHLSEVLVAYNSALTGVFLMATVVGCLSAIGALGMGSIGVKNKK